MDCEIDLDPFNIRYRENYDLIFSYLNGNDIKNLSSVSKFFWLATGQSKTAMSKIKFKINEKHGRILEEDVVNKSVRLYQHIDISGIFYSTDQICSLFKKNSASIKSIITGYDINLNGLTLPNLQVLTFYSLNLESSYIVFYINGLLFASTNLRELYVYGRTVCPTYMARAVGTNPKLKKLVLQQGAVGEEFFKALTYPFHTVKLESLRCETNFRPINSFWLTFLNFLSQQAPYLRDLRINCNLRILSKVFDILPNLRSITYYPWPALECGGDRDFIYYGHKGIEEANFIYAPPFFVEKFVRLTPNLKTLYIADLDFVLFQNVIRFAPSLRCLKYAYIHGKSQHELCEMYCNIMNAMQKPFQNFKITRI